MSEMYTDKALTKTTVPFLQLYVIFVSSSSPIYSPLYINMKSINET